MTTGTPQGSATPAAEMVVDGRTRRGSFQLALRLEVAPGEVVGVLGPNGAGKSTLLRTVAGLQALTDGSIRLGDLVLDDASADIWVAAELRPVGLVFQDYRLFPHLDVRDNVAFAARSKGLGRAESRRRADPYLERLELTGLTHRRPAELSGGQAQRVALARALAAEPGVLLMDEPLAALDARSRLEVRSALRHHLADFAGPVVVVTHDPLDAMVMADRLVVVEHGRVVQEGPPAAVARHPATDYVARLVGLNLYAGRLEPDRRTVALDGGGRLAVTLVPEAEGHSGRVLVALAPSAVSVHTGPLDHASQRNVWPGRVVGVEPLGDRVRVEVEGRPSAVVDVTTAALADLALVPGREVWLAAKATETVAYPEGP